jgi:spore coat protein U-like protein
MTKLRRVAAGLLGCLFILASSADSSAAPPEGCLFQNVQGMRFGAYNPRSSEPLDSASIIQFRCPNIDSVRIELSRGNSGSFKRSMRVDDWVMQYNLYLDAARTRVWGDGSSGTGVHTSTPTSNGAQRVTIYGRVPARQNPMGAGQYRDDIVMTMLF